MLRALDKHGQLINLLDRLPEKQTFRCPACNGSVYLRIGKVMRPHFAHYSLNNCYMAFENESAEHLSLKSKLYKSLSKHVEVEVETYIPEINQLADLLVAKKLALEIQCSRLSIDRLEERSRTYQSKGYHVRWLLGEKLWLKKKMTSLQKQMLYFSWQMGFHLWELDLAKNQIRLKYLIHEDCFGKVHYLMKTCDFKGDLMSFFRLPYILEGSQSFKVSMDEKILTKVQSALLRRDKRWLDLQEKAYLNGENVLERKRSDFYPQIKPVKSELGFCQISQDLTPYYKKFELYYQNVTNKTVQTLHPPLFYVKI